LTRAIANRRISAVLKPISGNKRRLETSEKSTAARITKHGKENAVAPARLPKRKADEKAVVPVPPRIAKCRLYNEEKAVLPSRVTKRKIDNNDQAVALLPRPIKHARTNTTTGLEKPLMYQERLAQAGRSWALLEKAAASKDWHKVLVSWTFLKSVSRIIANNLQ
jgi:hypothetical protein